MRKLLSLILALAMLLGMTVLAAEAEYTHAYKTSKTDPTCTEQGYTTYTCACGDNYVDNYVDALGHVYSAGVCTLCGEDTVTASLDGNILTLTGELAQGTRLI